MKSAIFGAVMYLLAISCSAQTLQKRNAPPRSDQPSSGSQSAQQNGDSSSKNTKIDLSPPKGDDIQHADSDVEEDTSGVMETKPWNPHKAAKDIEVGDFYARRKNYGAAISRYREALEYKPRDADATFRLAQALEATKQNDEALQRYEEYLKILPKGEFAVESQKAIDRLKAVRKTS
jgi:tetratricopeptide (TPR) repeat protein